MKTKNTKRAAIAIGLGVTLLATTAFADAVLGSGYASLKSSFKETSKFIAKDAKNFTVDMEYKISENDKVYYGGRNFVKHDSENGKEFSRDINTVTGSETSYYSDSGMSLYTYDDGTKHATIHEDIQSSDESESFPEDIFEIEEVKDFEKVVDAFVGSISDVVSVTNTDEGKVYNCTLNASQLPLYINAFASFGIKYTLFDEYHVEEYGLPSVKNDICITEASATVIADKNNVITDASGKAKFSGRDENGVVHEFVFELSGKLSDINSTVIETPSLDGAEISYSTATYDMGISEGDVGTYSRPIMENLDGKVQVVGEYTLSITSVDEEGLKGTFAKQYREGFEKDDAVSFDFEAKFDDMNREKYYGIPIKYNDGEGEKQAMLSKYDDVMYNIELGVEINDDEDNYRVQTAERAELMRVVK